MWSKYLPLQQRGFILLSTELQLILALEYATGDRNANFYNVIYKVISFLMLEILSLFSSDQRKNLKLTPIKLLIWRLNSFYVYQ